MADDPANQGLHRAHTAAAPAALDVDQERAAKVGTVKATAEAAMTDLANRLVEDENPGQHELLLADADEEFVLFKGPVRHVAKLREAAKRGRGRPAGSKNRKSADLANYLLSMGYRDPALNLADLANATPGDLAAELSCDTVDAMELIRKANAELLPYFHSKRPTEIKVDKRIMGVMVLGEMPTEAAQDDETIDLTRVDAPTQ